MIVRFLSSSQFPKVGKATAQKIYDYLKENTLSTLANNEEVYEKLLQHKIISIAQKESLIHGLKNIKNEKGMQILLKYGFSMKNIMKIESIYKDQMEMVFKSNPYQIIQDVEGIGFKTIDKLSLNLGIQPQDKRRIKAAILYSVLTLCHQSGDTYVFLPTIIKELNQLIEVQSLPFEESLQELIEEKNLILEENRYYHYTLYQAEQNIASLLKPYITRRLEVDFLNDLEFIIAEIEKEKGICYTLEQKESLIDALLLGLFIFTGGPGTG